ncbi:MAG: hypothetical protein JNN00_10660 [Chitinophagaceae bacterium]|nr:hypothetical protein [Chitinophagaceae bacterium]
MNRFREINNSYNNDPYTASDGYAHPSLVFVFFRAWLLFLLSPAGPVFSPDPFPSWISIISYLQYQLPVSQPGQHYFRFLLF